MAEVEVNAHMAAVAAGIDASFVIDASVSSSLEAIKTSTWREEEPWRTRAWFGAGVVNALATAKVERSKNWTFMLLCSVFVSNSIGFVLMFWTTDLECAKYVRTRPTTKKK